jgi:hypothetical protein
LRDALLHSKVVAVASAAGLFAGQRAVGKSLYNARSKKTNSRAMQPHRTLPPKHELRAIFHVFQIIGITRQADFKYAIARCLKNAARESFVVDGRQGFDRLHADVSDLTIAFGPMNRFADCSFLDNETGSIS